MNYNDHLSKNYKTYDYNGTLIIYDLGEEKNTKVIIFFDSYLKKTNSDISNIQKGRQSLINEYALYFVGKEFIKDQEKTRNFMIAQCGDE
ncbi:hypothetical protein [Chryseobacterium sp. JK1]|uniref:hypothetical protein n=1 Tax=Chryseobacterium sp. JK1 TaxID=874294 RepID=UPI003D681175